MFLAIIIPPARKIKVVAALVLLSLRAQLRLRPPAALSPRSPPARTILLTVALSAGAALLFPVKDAERRSAVTHSIYLYIAIMAGVSFSSAPCR